MKAAKARLRKAGLVGLELEEVRFLSLKRFFDAPCPGDGGAKCLDTSQLLVSVPTYMAAASDKRRSDMQTRVQQWRSCDLQKRVFSNGEADADSGVETQPGCCSRPVGLSPWSRSVLPLAQQHPSFHNLGHSGLFMVWRQLRPFRMAALLHVSPFHSVASCTVGLLGELKRHVLGTASLASLFSAGSIVGIGRMTTAMPALLERCL